MGVAALSATAVLALLLLVILVLGTSGGSDGLGAGTGSGILVLPVIGAFVLAAILHGRLERAVPGEPSGPPREGAP